MHHMVRGLSFLFWLQNKSACEAFVASLQLQRQSLIKGIEYQCKAVYNIATFCLHLSAALSFLPLKFQRCLRFLFDSIGKDSTGYSI